MVNEFLKKYQEELFSDKIELKEDIDLLDTKIKEETKFLSLLQETDDTYFMEFSPRVLNEKNREKAEEVKAFLDELQSQQQSLIEKMKFFDSRLLELNNLLNIETYTKPVINSSINDSSTNYINTDNTHTNDDIISKLEDIKNIILLDPYRASILLNVLIDSLKD